MVTAAAAASSNARELAHVGLVGRSWLVTAGR